MRIVAVTMIGEDEPVRDAATARSTLLARAHLRGHDRRAADEHEGEDADEFGGEVTPAVAHDEIGGWM